MKRESNYAYRALCSKGARQEQDILRSMEDRKRYKETHGHANVFIPEDKSLAQFCTQARYGHKNPGKGNKLTEECIAAFDAIGFNWTSRVYVARSFDEKVEDLEEYKQTRGHVNVKIHEDKILGQFCKDVRKARNKKGEKAGMRKLTEERIARLMLSASSGETEPG